MDQFYSTIGDVQRVLQERYERYGVRTSFVDALVQLRTEGALLLERPKPSPFFKPLSTPRFDELIQSLPVDATQIMENAFQHRQFITEDKTIPMGKDTFIIKHIPYVDDKLHSHNYFEINYMYSGSCIQMFENEHRRLNEGGMCIISPSARHNILVEPDCIALGILMRKSTFDRMFWNLLTQNNLLSTFFRHVLYGEEQSNYLYLQTDNTLEFKYFIQNILIEVNIEDSYANSNAANLLNVLFAKTLRLYSETIEFYETRPRLNHALDFSLLLQYIQKNYQTVTLHHLAQRFHFSEEYLSRRIKQNLGKGFSALIQQLKLNHAAEALRSSVMSVREVAATVGYDSVDHFSRSFKKAYGLSPQAFRKQSTATGEAASAKGHDK